jgi:hypothetical protein
VVTSEGTNAYGWKHTQNIARSKVFSSHKDKVQSVLGSWNLFFYLLVSVAVLFNMTD